jgi:hypothetical protein
MMFRSPFHLWGETQHYDEIKLLIPKYTTSSADIDLIQISLADGHSTLQLKGVMIAKNIGV